MCREARKMERAGKSVDEIVKYLEDIKYNVRVILTLDTLEYAKMSGRVKTLQAALASVLNVKPIAILREWRSQYGRASPHPQSRTGPRDRNRKRRIWRQAGYLAVVHARDLKSGESLLEEAKKHFNAKETMMSDLAISIAANLGPGTVGLIVYPLE